MRASTLTTEAPVSPIGRLLKRWRKTRRMSQLDLALTADASARHLSFVETGRAKPSRDMVLRLTEALEIPFRERNEFLVAAGFAPQYRARALEDQALGQARKALELMLANHAPYPAFVLNRRWDMVMANAAAEGLMRALGRAPDPAAPPANAIRLVVDPEGLRPFIVNWAEVAHESIMRARREAAAYGDDPELAALIAEIEAYPGVAEILAALPEGMPDPSPLVAVELALGDQRLSWFSTIATFGTPRDATLQELRIESLFPADLATEAWVQAAAR